MPFHDLRHSAATMLTEMEVDVVTVSRMLGHSTPAITMKLYGHTTSALNARARLRSVTWTTMTTGQMAATLSGRTTRKRA
jgi:integrase